MSRGSRLTLDNAVFHDIFFVLNLVGLTLVVLNLVKHRLNTKPEI